MGRVTLEMWGGGILDRDVPGADHAVVADEDRSDPPLHTVRTAGRQGGEVLIKS